jgi:transmembrane sensor
MKTLKDLLNRFTRKTATPEENLELFDKYGEQMVNGLFDQEKGRAETEAERILREKQFDKITAKLPELADEDAIPIHRNKYHVWGKAAAAVLVIALAAGLWINKDAYFVPDLSQKTEAAKPSVYSGKQLINLPDGSTVLLNANSELRVSTAFGASDREVTLSGEALFDVTHDASKPFVVRTGKVSTTVLGTSFNVAAYSGETKIRVTVVRGFVQVEDNQRIFGKISPDEQMEVDVRSNDFVKRAARAEEALAWQKDFFILENVTFAQAALLIEKRFNVKVTIANESLKDCVVSAWFINNESLKQIVDGLSLVHHATAVIDGDRIVIEGGRGCK